MIDDEVKEYVDERMQRIEQQYANLLTLLQAYQNSMNGQFQGMRDSFKGLELSFHGLENSFHGLENSFHGLENRMAAVEMKMKVESVVTDQHQLVRMYGDISQRLSAVEERLKDKPLGFQAGA